MIGNLVAGGLADKFGTKLICGLFFAVAAIGISMLSVKMPLVLIYLFAGVAGAGVFAAMVLVFVHRPVLPREQPRFGAGLGGRDR